MIACRTRFRCILSCIARLSLVVLVVFGFVVHGIWANEEVLPASRATRVPWNGSRFQGAPDPPPPYRVQLAFPKLKFHDPVTITNAPNTDRLFVVEVNGRAFSFLEDEDSEKKDLFADFKAFIPKLTQTYGMTFHPEYPAKPYVYVCYILESGALDGSVIARFQVEPSDPPRIMPDSERIVLRWLAGGHNGCSIKFGADGLLYISTGDGTGPNPPDLLMAGQDVSNLLSAILRIDVDRTEGERNYAVPADNPFVHLEGARPEIWAYGFRNPWKMSFDRQTGELWVGDVGWDTWELVYRVERGGNYGWSIMEGSQPIHPTGKRGPTPIRPPVTQHDHAEARSITGGFVYRGNLHPDLFGAYLYGDFATGKIWGLRYDGSQLTERLELADSALQIIGWAETNAGELYLMDYQRTNQIYKLVPNEIRDHGQSFPRRLTDTGLFRSVKDLLPADGVIPFEVNVPYWVDGTKAERLLALPGQSQIDGDLQGRWDFPEGTVVARTVTLDRDGFSQRLETQILHREHQTWRHYTYVWNEQQDDAILAPPEGTDLLLSGSDEQNRVWRVASRAECKLCHSPNLGAVLGLTWLQANHATADSASQLANWYADGILASKPPSHRFQRRLVDPFDESVDLDRRARSYLHANCVHCHQPGGVGASVIHLDYSRALTQTYTLDQKPGQGTLGLHDGRIIAPSDPFRSVLFYRLAKQGPGRMPHVGVSITDQRGLKLIYDWIAAMEPSNTAARPALDAQLRALAAGQDSAHGEQMLDSLMSAPDGCLAITWMLYANELSEDLRQQVLDRCRQRPEPFVADLLEPFLPAEQRKQRLGTRFDPNAILSLTGDIARGRHLYWNGTQVQCRACHQVFGNGGDLGPALSAIGKKYKPHELLHEIVAPSNKIDPEFVTYGIVTSAGNVVSGRVMQRDAQQIVVKTADQRLLKMAPDQIQEMSPSPASLMPEHLLRELDAQQAADLLAYLMTLN